jgi:hypothetical protein
MLMHCKAGFQVNIAIKVECVFLRYKVSNNKNEEIQKNGEKLNGESQKVE